MIKKYYFINKLDTKYIDNQDKETIIIYRNYRSKKPDEKLILKIKEYCKKKRNKFYWSNDIKLAIRLDLDGAYIPSFNNSFKHLSYSFKKDFKIIGSAHNTKEIKIKELQKCSEIFLSPLFLTKKYKTFLGIIRFNLITKKFKKKFVALGGIKKSNFIKLLMLNIVGFAGISMFKKKAPKKGPLNKNLIN